MASDQIRYPERSAQVREYIIDFKRLNGYPPSINEIRRHLGLRSTSHVHDVIQRMIADGVLIAAPGIARSIRVVETVLPESGTTT